MSGMEMILSFAKILLVFIPLGLIPVMIFLERKGAAVIQDRVGPNRAGIRIFGVEIRGFGMVHNFSDVVKLIFKEDFIPAHAHKAFYVFAPMIPVMVAVMTPALIPWFGPMASITGSSLNGAVLDFNVGLLFLFAMSALSVYGIVIGSWASNSKYSLLGGMRSSAMMISYEVSMGLSILGLILIIGSFNMTQIVEWQSNYTWGIVVQPVAFFLFLAAMFAETGRTPFDVAEGESEIVGGFHTEFSSIKFALYFMGEYAHVVIASALMATLFFGGYDLLPIPGFGGNFIADNLGYVLAVVLVGKVAIFWGLAALISRQRRRYRTLKASDADGKEREYSLMRFVVFSLGVVCLLGAVLAAWLIGRPERALTAEGSFVHADWVGVLTAFVQIGVVLAKTLFFCWLFVWVRWTVPRLRYDQIMDLGWKVLLNVALINLLVTAVIVMLIKEGL
ncbi:MAG: NADH-quinone oxidoreductase subunit H [Planctomycetota bacterium]|nr:MAG: NADH-quinone oxidoreductase subunit H [Planctomycetota bacterium]